MGSFVGPLEFISSALLNFLKFCEIFFSCNLNPFVLWLRLNLKNMSFELSGSLTNSVVNAAEDEQNEQCNWGGKSLMRTQESQSG